MACLRADPHSSFVNFDMCRYGPDFRKPTRLLTNMPALSALGLCCNHDRRHMALIGSAATSAAGAYPQQLCTQWSDAALTLCPDTGFGERAAWQDEWGTALEKLVGRRPETSAATCRVPGRALRYLDNHGTVFGGSVGYIPAGAHRQEFGIDPPGLAKEHEASAGYSTQFG